MSAEVEPADEDCDWPSDPEDSLPVSRLPYYAPEMRTFRNCWTGTFTGNFSGPDRVLGPVCVCVHACVRVCMHACVSACVRVCFQTVTVVRWPLIYMFGMLVYTVRGCSHRAKLKAVGEGGLFIFDYRCILRGEILFK